MISILKLYPHVNSTYFISCSYKLLWVHCVSICVFYLSKGFGSTFTIIIPCLLSLPYSNGILIVVSFHFLWFLFWHEFPPFLIQRPSILIICHQFLDWFFLCWHAKYILFNLFSYLPKIKGYSILILHNKCSWTQIDI